MHACLSRPFTIRDEQPSDIIRIGEVTELAFRNAPHTCRSEHLIVAALRAAGALSVSLVAVADSIVVGHVALSPLTLSHASGSWYGLGPISVVPEKQRTGLGTALMNAALSQIQLQNAAGCVLVGDPHFYFRFGFTNDATIIVEGVPPMYTLTRRIQSNQDRGTAKFHCAFDIAVTA